MRESLIEECKLLPERERIAKLREYNKLDNQYYFNDQDRIALSKVSSYEREIELERRRDKIKMQSDKIALMAERIRESEEKQAKKSKAQKSATLTAKKRKASDSSVSVVSVDRRNRMKTTKEVDPIAED